MATCWAPGAAVQLSYSDDPRRKLAWTLERVDMGAGWVGVHTGRPNAALAQGIAAGRIPNLAGYRDLRREIVFSPAEQEGGRLDLALGAGPAPDALVEIKNCTLLDGDYLRFPDAVSLRGRKHLNLLASAVGQGRRGVMLFALNRPEGQRFAPAWAVDPAYGRRLAEVAALGVEVLAVRLCHTATGLEVGEGVPVDLAEPPDLGPPR
jgi:sugar fermentation stimulation protein A